MTETLTLEEINHRFPDEWVLIGEPETDESNEVVRGKVMYHGDDREEMYQAAMNLPSPYRFATHYTGELFDPDVVYVL